MAYPLFGRCPVCGDELTVTRLECRRCDSALEGRFEMGSLGKLSADQLAFVELFIRCEGKLTRVGDELDVSYPTVRSRLNDVIRTLGYEVDPDAHEDSIEQRRNILLDLSEGTITPEEAVTLLKKV
jgi:hypothetical protein